MRCRTPLRLPVLEHKERQPMTTFKNAMVRLISDEEGASAVEYGLLVSLIAVVIIAVVRTLGQNAKGKFDTAAAGIGQ
jgi:pilus assembly protein Flp/PilA